MAFGLNPDAWYGKGSKRQRTRRKEVAGPYRSQSSDPKIRSQATEREHRKVLPVAPPPPSPFALPKARISFDPQSGYSVRNLAVTPEFSSALANLLSGREPYDPSEPARLGSVERTLAEGQEAADDGLSLSSILGGLGDLYEGNSITGNPGRELLEDEISNFAKAVKQNYDPERIGQPPTPEQTGALATVLAPVPLGAGARGAEAIKALRAGEDLVSGARGARALSRAAAQKSPALRAAAERVGQAVERVPAPVRAGVRGAAKVASYPVRHPIQAPFAAQVPVAAFQGDPGEMTKALTGQGVYANVLGDIAKGLGGIPGEAVSLPAAIVPSAYMTGKAGVDALQGDTTEAERLFDEWKETGILPALAKGVTTGDWSDAGDALVDHPLYSGLEASGALNAAGRVAGAGLRSIPGTDIAGLEREPLVIPGTKIQVERGYSRDALRQAAQRLYDRRRGNEITPGSQRAAHYEKQAANRFSTDQETTRRQHAREQIEALQEILPKKWLGGRKLDRKSAEAVPLAVERLIQDPSTFAEDLGTYKKLVDWAAKEVDDHGHPRLNKEQLKRNRENAEVIDDALKSGNPEAIVKAADRFIELQKPILDEMVELGLMTPERAAMASAIPFARVHMGAGWGKPKDGGEEMLLDRQGNPLPHAQIAAEMKRRGIEPPGFLSHRAPSAGDYYRPPFGGAVLEKGSRSGASVLAGMQQGGIEGLVRQLRRAQGLVDRAKSWNQAITQFGMTVPGVKTWADAKRILEDPSHYITPEGQELVAVPRHPFFAKKEEIEGALAHQDPIAVEEGAGAHLNAQIDRLHEGGLPDDTPIAFMPRKVGEQLRRDSESSPPELKAMQAATNLFKRAVLPFSPSFYIGNVFDNYMRTLVAGVNPYHAVIGYKALNALAPERREQIMSGALFSSVDRLAPHRSVENVVTGSGSLARTMREAAEWTHKHGVKQAAVKAVPRAVADLSKYLMAVNRLVSERLPSYGVLGKAVAQDLRKTQGSWFKALAAQEKALKEWAEGIDNPATRTHLQKRMEETLGNYSQMSPGARKVLSNVVPFWTWMRAAYKFVYLTMPAHRSVQTGLLTATAAATQVEREQLGLEKGAEGELDAWQQGGIPTGDGQVIPMAGYNSFGFAADPLEAVSRAGFAQFKNIIDAAGGVDWRGEPIPSEDRVAAAALAAAGGFLPGFNQLFRTDQGSLSFEPHLSIPKPYDAQKAEDKILVPTGGDSSGGSESTMDLGKVFSGSSSSGMDMGKVFSGGG